MCTPREWGKWKGKERFGARQEQGGNVLTSVRLHRAFLLAPPSANEPGLHPLEMMHHHHHHHHHHHKAEWRQQQGGPGPPGRHELPCPCLPIRSSRLGEGGLERQGCLFLFIWTTVHQGSRRCWQNIRRDSSLCPVTDCPFFFVSWNCWLHLVSVRSGIACVGCCSALHCSSFGQLVP